MKMFCDNQSSIKIAKNPVHHDRTKHIEINHNFMKEKIEKGKIKLLYIPTSTQVADILIKALPRNTFEILNSKLSLYNIYNPA